VIKASRFFTENRARTPEVSFKKKTNSGIPNFLRTAGSGKVAGLARGLHNKRMRIQLHTGGGFGALGEIPRGGVMSVARSSEKHTPQRRARTKRKIRS